MAINLNVTINKNGSMTVRWPAVANAARYSGRVSIPSLGVAEYSNSNLTTTSFTTDTNLPENKTYKITVAAYNQKNSQLASGSKTVTIPKGYVQEPLGVPQNVKAVADTISVTVSYNAVTRASSYDVLFDGTVYSVTGTSRRFSGLKPKTSHTYAVRAKNATQTGAYSATKSVTTLPQSPGVPSNIKKTATETSATISWGALSGATGYSIKFNGTTYNVTAASKTFTGLTAGKAYPFSICSRNADTSSAYTSQMTVTTPAKPPSNISATSTGDSVTIRWNAVSGVSGYIIKFDGMEYHVPATSTSDTVKNLRQKTSHTYQICCKSADGTGSYSSQRTIMTQASTPSVPTGITKTADSHSAVISWTDKYDATEYIIQFNGKSETVSGTSKKFTGLTANTAYRFKLCAKNWDVTSAYTSEMTVKTAPLAPADVSADSTENSVTVRWDAVSGALGYIVSFDGKNYDVPVSSTSKTFTGLADNTDHEYQVYSKGVDGASTGRGMERISTIRHGLTVPTGISHKSADNSVTVSWNAVSGAAGYDVEIGGRCVSVTGTSGEVTGLTPNTLYNYRVRSRLSDGATGRYSEGRTFKTTPRAPEVSKRTANESTATISWNEISGADSYDLLFNGSVYHMNTTSGTFTGLAANTGYDYQIRVNTADGSSTYSTSKTVWTAPNPPASATVTATAANDSITVRWGAVPGAKEYYVLVNGTKTYSANGTSRRITGLEPGTSYTYQICSCNEESSSSYCPAKTIVTLPNPPAVPANISAASTTDSITLTWGAVPGADSYDIRLGDSTYRVAGTSKTLTGLTPDTAYSYQVRANNAGGSSAYSEAGTVRTLPEIPAVPVIYAAMTDVHSIEFAWKAVDGADSYEFLFDGTLYTLTELEKKFEGLESDTEHTYRIRARNKAGASPYSGLQKIRTRLAVPENIRAEAEAKSVRISFDPVAGATSYDIEFQNAVYHVTETSKVFEGLKPETEYTYAVRAVNEYGCSLYSETKRINTLRLGPAMPSDITAAAFMGSVIVSWSPVESAEDYDVRFDSVDYHVAESGTVTLVQQEDAAGSVMAASASAMSGRSRMKAAPAAGKAAGETVSGRIYKIFAGLRPHTRYSYSARANNAEGSSKYTPEKYVTTDVQKSSGLANGRNFMTYPDGRISYTGNDPVNALTGAFLWSYTWLEDHGKDGLHFTAMYDSRREIKPDVLGKKWSHSLNYLLEMDEEYAYFHTPYDDVTAFRKNTEDGDFRPEDSAASSYTMKENEDGSYSVAALDGTEYVFDGKLCLNRIVENGLVSYRFRSDGEGRIIRMEGRHGTAMDITYVDGTIAAVTDAMGNTVRFAYEEGRLAAVTNPEGREMSFTYDAACRLLTISDFSGEVYLTNRYDMQGRVTEQTTAGRGRSLAAYDEENRTTEFTDELGNVTRYTYDAAGHVTEVALAGTAIHNTYNEKGQMTEQTDALGNSTGMEYDEYGRMIRVIHPDGTEESAAYNDRNQPVKVTGRDGTNVLYQYDERNNLIRMQDERGNTNSYTYDENDNLISFTDRSGHIWTYAYDENNHLEQAADPDGNICFYTHDAIGRMTSYTSPEGRKVSYRFSAAGDLLSVEDADGEIVFEYNENGSRTGMTDRMGNKQRLEYNETGRVSLAADALGNAYSFSYDGKGNLITETDPSGYSVSSTYDACGNRTSQTDKNGGVTRYVFDAANRLIRVCDAAGGTVSYTYDCMGQVTAVTDQLSRQRSYVYDKAGRVLSETDPLGHSVGYTYDAAGNLLTRTDEDGHVISYTYDAQNRLQSVQTDAGITTFVYDHAGRVVSVTDADGHTESAEYDSDDNLTAVSDKESRKTVYVYDSMGRIAQETAPDGGKTAYSYDKNGNCVQITDAEGHVTGYEYDACSRLVKVTDPSGQETAYAYDGRGQLVRMTDANGGVTEYAYDGNGNLVSEVNPLGGEKTWTYDVLNRLTGGTDEEGGTWSCTYDAAGNRMSFTDACGHVRTYEYDAGDRLTGVTEETEGSLELEYTNTGRVSRVTDMEGAVTDYTYDAMGRLLRISDAMGHSTSFTYDSAGRALTRTDANGNTTQYEYSPAGNLLSVTDGEGNATAYTYNALGLALTETDALGNTVSYTYDHLGQVTSMTDAMGSTTSFTYTAEGRIAAVENAEGGVTRYTYDACGNLVQTEDALGRVVQYEYDAMNNRIRECLAENGEQSCITLYVYDKKGRMIREIDPLLEETAYAYDGNDSLVSVTDGEQRETTVTYDLNRRPVSVAYSDGRTAAFRYNRRGELVEMQDWNGTTAMERDVLGRLTGVMDHNGRKTGFTYDAAGNRTGIRYPDGSAAAYAFDKNNRLLTVTEYADGAAEDTGETAARYAYDAAGSVVSLIQPGSAASYAYNAGRQPVKAVYRFGETAGMEETFTYDVLGRITGSVRSGSRPEFARTAAYGYDAAGQLVSCRNGEAVETYAYDALGNRTARSLNGVQKAAYRYNALNQLVSMTEDGVDHSFGYDRCGNLTEERRGDSLIRQYVYDTAGRMVLGRNAESGEESAYAYNALQMCVGNMQKLAAGDGFRSREMQYVPDFLSGTDNELMAYETGAGSVRTVFGHGYQRLCQCTAEGKTFFQSDIYGSPLFAADGQGTVRQYAERGIWGGLKAGTEIPAGLEENLRFTSYRHDPVLGKHFAHARFYDDANGRMLALDPVRRDLNGYRYCDDDPVNYADPTGEVLNIIGGALLGGVFGGAGGLISSAVSQKLNGGEVDWKKAWGAAANGAITGAVQGGLVASGAGIPVALASNFLAGAAGSAAEQYISEGKVDARKSITSGLTNAVSNAIYGTKPLNSVKGAFLRGAGAGAATAGINYISDLTGQNPGWGGPDAGFLTGMAGKLVSPYGEVVRDPRRGCGSASPFVNGFGHGSSKGYRYDVPRAGGAGQKQRKKFSLKEFLRETAVGGITGGVASAGFYGAGKGIGRLKDSFRAGKSNIPTLENTGEVRYRKGEPVSPMEVSYEMRLNPEGYAYAVAEKYGINLRGSGQKINIKFDPNHIKGPGVSKELDPTNIILGPQALISEEELARTISHELNHARSWLKGGRAPEETARAAEDALGAFINGGR